IPVPYAELTKILKGSGSGANTISSFVSPEQPNFGWTAVHDFMPPGPPELRVGGLLLMPTPGWKLSLAEHNPPGFNPTILILDLLETPPEGVVNQVMTPTPVAFVKGTNSYYSHVMILLRGEL